MDLVSIIMPSFNCGKYISDSINSIQAQTYPNWELIIVDDCSSDNTIPVISTYMNCDKRIRLIQNQINCGTAASRNKALKEAKGRWIAFLDSDDLWEPRKLERQISFMEANGFTFSYTNYQEIDDNSSLSGVLVSGPKHISRVGMKCFCWPGCLTVMYDSWSIGLIQIEEIRKNNDYAMWLKVSKIADCYLLNDCLGLYRRGRIGSVSSHSTLTMIGWHYKLWRYAEKRSVFCALLFTSLNLVCGLYKKIFFVKRMQYGV